MGIRTTLVKFVIFASVILGTSLSLASRETVDSIPSAVPSTANVSATVFAGYWANSNPESPRCLWKTDGTEVDVKLIKLVCPGRRTYGDLTDKVEKLAISIDSSDGDFGSCFQECLNGNSLLYSHTAVCRDTPRLYVAACCNKECRRSMK